MPNRAVHQFPTTSTREDTDLFYIVRSGSDLSLPASLLAPALQVASVNLSAASVLTLFAAPVQVTPSAPAGKVFIPVRAFIRFEGGSADYATNTTLVVGSSSLVPSDGGILATSIADRTATPLMLGNTGEAKVVPGDALSVAVETGNPTTGDSPITVTVYYMVYDA